MQSAKADIFAKLQEEVLGLQGIRLHSNALPNSNLGPISAGLPGGSFPLGAVHEFLCEGHETAASTVGFLGGLISSVIGNKGVILWASASRTIFPPGLKSFGLDPHQFIFIDLNKSKEILWTMEEALKCGALTAVVGELTDLTFTASRRLQLAVEQSKVTGFILRSRLPGTTACVSRWRISPSPSHTVDNMPGIGIPQWKVELLRMRNGKPGSWEIRWEDGAFVPSILTKPADQHPDTEKAAFLRIKTG
jgi:protein ImuA